jgi:hypothetical protein
MNEIIQYNKKVALLFCIVAFGVSPLFSLSGYEYITATGIQQFPKHSQTKPVVSKTLNKNILKKQETHEPVIKILKQKRFKKYKNRCLLKNKYQTIIKRISNKYNVDADLVTAVIAAESCFKPKIVSPKGAQGLMQLMPFTAKRFGVNNSFDPMQNIMGGVKYLRFLLRYFNNDIRLAVAAYNAGEGAVNRYKGVPPYKETRNYVIKVLSMLDHSTVSKSTNTSKEYLLKTNYKKSSNQSRVTNNNMSNLLKKNKQKQLIQEPQNCISNEHIRRYTYEVFQANTSKRYYLLKQGETLKDVANKTGVTLQQLEIFNKKMFASRSSISRSILVWECKF